MASVLICSPVRRKAAILRHFLRSLNALDIEGHTVNYAFIDDTDDDESRDLLRGWEPDQGHTYVLVPKGATFQEYSPADDYHMWGPQLAARVAAWRNKLLHFSLEGGYDYTLLVDSDLVLDPATLTVLLRADKDIVYEVFWTRFYRTAWQVPNVWLWGECGQYRVYPDENEKTLTRQELQRRAREWFSELRVPGLYEVGGGGACTLMSRRVLEAGVNYAPIPNLGWWGEDRFFQVRASVAGLSQWADTHVPPIHLYRSGDLRALPLQLARRGAKERGRIERTN